MIETRIYNPETGQLLKILPDLIQPTWQEVLNGEGSGKFQIDYKAPALVEVPSLLDYGNIVEMTDGEGVFSWVIETKEREILDDDALIWDVSGRGLRSVLGDAITFPEPGLDSDVPLGDNRSFGPMVHPDGGYFPADYDSLPSAVGVAWDADTLEARAGYPTNWADDSAQWIWKSNPSDEDDIEEIWMVWRTTYSTPGLHTIYATADNSYELYLNGQLIMSGNDYKTFQEKQITFTGETDLWFAVRVANTGPTIDDGDDSGAGFLMSMVTPAETVALRTTTAWKVFDPAVTDPGIAANAIMASLMDEGVTRGVGRLGLLNAPLSIPAVGPKLVRSFPNGTSLTDVLAQLTESLVDVRVVGRDLVFYDEIGTDLTTGNDPVVLHPARDIRQASYKGDASSIRTVLMVKTDEQITVKESAPGISAHGRRESLLSLGASDVAVADSVVEYAFRERANPAEQYEIQIATDHVRPYRDFDIGDWVLLPALDGTFDRRRVQAITVGVDKAGNMVYTPEFSTIMEDAETRQQRWLKSISAGTLGGTVASASPTATAGSVATDKSLQGIPATLSGHVIKDATAYPQRLFLRITGPGVEVTDDSGTDSTVVTVGQTSDIVFDLTSAPAQELVVPAEIDTGTATAATAAAHSNEVLGVLRAVLDALADADIIQLGP